MAGNPIPNSGAFQDRATEVREGEELDLAMLESFLRVQFRDETGPLPVRQFPSGHSNLTYSVSLGSREMVLRRPPFGSKVKSAHDMGREDRVLSKLYTVYPTPRALLPCDDPEGLAAPFSLIDRIQCFILRRQLPPALLTT